MAGKFELYKDKSGQFRFRLKAGNGEIIATSESYKTKASATNGIESVKTNAPNAVVDDQNLSWPNGAGGERIGRSAGWRGGGPPHRRHGDNSRSDSIADRAPRVNDPRSLKTFTCC